MSKYIFIHFAEKCFEKLKNADVTSLALRSFIVQYQYSIYDILCPMKEDRKITRNFLDIFKISKKIFAPKKIFSSFLVIKLLLL